MTHSQRCFASTGLWYITYMETSEGVCYLSPITDLYSHKIVGWSVGPTLERTYLIEDLSMVYKTIDEDTTKCIVHHSDWGCQYCSRMYVTILKRQGTQISKTQGGDPLENAVAECANGILKTEWLYRKTIPTRSVQEGTEPHHFITMTRNRTWASGTRHRQWRTLKANHSSGYGKILEKCRFLKKSLYHCTWF